MKFSASSRQAMRAIIARGVAGRRRCDPHEYAAERWRGDSPVTYGKASVGGSLSADWSVTASPAVLFDAVTEDSIAGRAGLRLVPPNVKLIRPNSAARGYWVAQSKAIPLSKVSTLGSALESRKVGAIVVTTMESLETNDARVERAVEADFRRALTLALDDAFIDPSNGGVAGEMPASVTYGAPTVASTGDIRADMHELVEHFTGDFGSSVLVMHPLLATQVALVTDSSGSLVFPDIGPRGGSLMGLPVLTSRAVPHDSSGGSIALIDGSGIAAVLEGMDATMTDQATLEMSDDPAGAGDTPTAASVVPVNLFQNELVAFKVVLRANWEVQRPGAVAVITGASY